MEALKGKIVLLTGGSRGVGPVIAEALVKKGSTVVLAARSESGLQEIASRLRKAGYRVNTAPADLRQSFERERLIATVLKELGRLDILINNAGLETEGAFAELPWPAIEETIEVNLLAPMELTRLVLPEMLKRKSGHIVNIASVAAKSGAPYASDLFGKQGGIGRMGTRTSIDDDSWLVFV